MSVDEVYHGTRLSMNQIKSDGITAIGCIRYQGLIKEALNDFNIPLQEAEKDPVVANELAWLSKGEYAGPHPSPSGHTVCDDVWVTTDKKAACEWAERSPEKVTMILDQLKVPWDTMQEYLAKKLGEPKVVTLAVPPDISPPIERGESNVPIGQYIPPQLIKQIERCPLL